MNIIPATCDVEECLENWAQVLVMHHCESTESTEYDIICEFIPYRNEGDELHCIIRLCNVHANEFRSLQGGPKETEIQFKDTIHSISIDK